MQKDVIIIGAGPAGIFTALEMLKRGSKQKILIVEKGRAGFDLLGVSWAFSAPIRVGRSPPTS